MTYFPNPKNKSKKAVLTRDGAPDYLIPAFATFPVPTIEEAGAILEIRDTGTRYRWSGTTWILQRALADVTEVSDRGSVGLAVYVQDQTTGVLDLPFLNERSVPTLTADITTGDIVVNVASGHGGSVGDTLELATTGADAKFMQTTILAITTTTLTIDSPASQSFPVVGTTLLISNKEMNVDGSVTPVVYSIAPLPNQIGDVVRVVCTMTGTADMDFETFGSIPALARGLLLRVNNGDGTYRNIYNFKRNEDLANYAYDIGYFTNKGGGLRGLTSRLTWGGSSKHGVVIRLDGNLGESLELLVQDDLTGLSSIEWLAQGSEVQN